MHRKIRKILFRLTFVVLSVALSACSGGGGGGGGGAPNTSTPPGSPTISSVVGGDSNVTISWSSVSGATSYNLYWSTSSGVTTSNGTKITGVTSPYVHSGRTNGTTYYYILTAVNSAGESAPSGEAFATANPPLPGSPTIFSVVGNSTQVTLNWYAVSGATSYNLYWSTSSGVTTSNGTKITGVAGPYVHSGLTNGTTYYYILTAVNAAGEGAPSSQVSATPNPPPPGWSSAAQLDAVDFYYTNIYPVAADINNTGTAIAVWIRGSTSSMLGTLYAGIYRNGTWGASFQLGGTGSLMPAVSVMSAGDIIAVYVQQVWDASWITTTSQAIYSRRYNHLTGTWTAAELIGGSATTGYAYDPSVVADSNGNAMAVWTDPSCQVYARRYNATLGAWEASATQLSSSPRCVYTPKVVVDGSNVFTAVWVEDSAAYDPGLPGGGPNHGTAMARRYASGSWGSGSQRIGRDPATSYPYGNFDGAGRFGVDANAAGNVFVVWEQFTTLADASTLNSVDTAWFNPGAGTWSSPSSITTNTNYLSWPTVAVDSTGNAKAAWNRTDPATSATSAQVASFSMASGTWGVPQQIDQGSGTVSGPVLLGMDSSGNAEAIWEDNNGNSVVERRYNATGGTGWGTFKTFSPSPFSAVFSMSDAGYGVLLGTSETLSYSTFINNAWVYILTP